MSTPTRCLLVAFVISLSLLHPNYAAAQAFTGSITGIVTDSQGAALAGAKVVAKNTDTGVITTTTSNVDGVFQMLNVLLGPYEVTIEATGFKRSVATDVRVESTNIVRVDRALEIGSVSDTVQVDANGTLVETEKIATGATLNENLVQNAPATPAYLSFRDATVLINLTPGASGSFFGVNIAGGRAFAQEVQTDGVPQLWDAQATYVLTVKPAYDVVSEVYVQPGVPKAEFGRSSGGIVTELTRAGTKAFHGDIGTYFRNSALDSRAYNARTVAFNQQYELPISLGGPIILPGLYNGKARSFFFFNYDHYWQKGNAAGFNSVPTALERTGDFSDQLANNQIIYDPATDVNGVRQPFPGNKIPMNRLSPLALKVLALVPNPTNGGLNNNFFGSIPFGRYENHYFGRVDHNITPNNKVFGATRFDKFVGTQDGSAYLAPAISTQGFNSLVRVLNIQDDWVVSKRLVNHASANVIRIDDLGFGSKDVNGITVPGVYGEGNSGVSQFPQFNITNYAPIGTVFYTITDNTTYNYQDAVSLLSGKHNYKFGIRFDVFDKNVSNYSNREGTFNFSGQETGIGPNQTAPPGSTTGNAYASFLLGLVDNASTTLSALSHFRSKYLALYAQDNWKVTPRLTLEYGLRWDLQTPFSDADGAQTYMDPTKPNPGAGGRLGALVFAGKGIGRTGSNQFMNPWKKGFAPRFGFAYDLGHDTVVRAGYGLLYGPYQGDGGPDQTGFSGNSSAASLNGGYNAAFTLDAGFPSSKLEHPPFIDPAFANGNGVVLLDKRDGRSNRLQDNQLWQLDLQHPFKGVYIDAAYVGEVGHHIPGGGIPNFNQVNPKYLTYGALLTKDINDPAVVAAGFTPPYPGFAGSLAQALRPFPQYSNITTISYPSGSSSWNGFLLQARKRYSNGLTYLVAYTWSKEFSDVGFSQFGNTTTQDTYNPRAGKSLGDLDIRHNLQLSYNYELPVGKGKSYLNHGFMGRLVEGLGLSGVHSYESGLPIHVIPSSAALPIFNNDLEVNINPGVPLTLSSRGNTVLYNGLYDPNGTAHGTTFLNPAAFSNPAPFSFGNARHFLDGAHQLAFLNENISIYKRTQMGEGRVAELRLEMYNAFNRKNFGGLDTTVGDSHFGEYTSENGDIGFGTQPGPKVMEIVFKFSF